MKMEIKYHKFKLKNGIRVFVIPKKDTQSIFIEALFKVGARCESDDVRGISHFLEHMAFKGTKKRPTVLHISKEIERYGGAYNAYTGLDVTGYWVRLPYEHLGLGIDLLADILMNSKLDKKEIDKEKGVILQEMKMDEDSPDTFAWKRFYELVFGDTPLGRDILGTEESLKKTTRETMVKFKSRYYKPDNMTIAIGGNLSISKTKKLIEKYFGKMDGNVKDGYEKNNVQQKAPIVKVHSKKEHKQAKVVIGFRSFGRDEDRQKRAVRSLMASILGGYSSSKLFTEIREKRGLCYHIGSGVDIFDETGFFGIASGLDVSKIPEALEVIFKILREIKEKGFDKKEIQMGKDNAIGRLRLGLESTNGWVSNIADQALYEKDIELPDKKVERIKKITNQDIKKMARGIFRPENLNMVISGPIDPKEEKKYLKMIKL